MGVFSIKVFGNTCFFYFFLKLTLAKTTFCTTPFQPSEISSEKDNWKIDIKSKKKYTPAKEKFEHQAQYESNPENLQIGDFVFADLPHSSFNAKSYDIQRGAYYEVAKINALESPVLYQLRDLAKELIPMRFYRKQLFKTKKPSKDTVFKVEKVLRVGKGKQKGQSFVKYLFYPQKFSAWIPTADIILPKNVAQ